MPKSTGNPCATNAGKHPRTVLVGLLLAPFLPVVQEHEVVIPAQEQRPVLERIAVRSDGTRAAFYLASSGEAFFADGFNYIRLRGGDHATFDAATATTAAHYDAHRAEAMFTALRSGGYTTVRVFITGRSPVNPGIAGDYATTRERYEPYMRNVVDFLQRATRHGIRVLPAFGDGEVPLNAYYDSILSRPRHEKNAFYLTEEGIRARTIFITSFLSYIKNREPGLLPTLLGISFQNEWYLRADQWPFDQREGILHAPNGRSYDLSDTSARQALQNEGLHYYHRQLSAAVKEIDPELLVTEGVFVPRAVGKDAARHTGLWPGQTRDERYPPLLTVIGEGVLDFLDVHFYRDNAHESVEEAFRLNLESSGFFTSQMHAIRRSKPLLLGEFGAFDFVEPSFEEAVRNMVRVRDLALAEQVNGLVYWTYDCFEQPRLHHAAYNWEVFTNAMRSGLPAPPGFPRGR